MKITNLFKFGTGSGDTPWRPTYKWYAVVTGIILLALITAFFLLNIFLKPYMRQLPLDITPWLAKSNKEEVKTDTVNNNTVARQEITHNDD